jgi:hypothetical protein
MLGETGIRSRKRRTQMPLLNAFLGFRLAQMFGQSIGHSQAISLASNKQESKSPIALALALMLMLTFGCPAKATAQAIQACAPDPLKISKFIFPENLMLKSLLLQQPTARPQDSTINMTQTRLLAASYYSLRDDLKATLMLSNQGPNPMNVSVSLFSLSGEQFTAPSFTLKGNEVRGVDLSAWMQAAGQKFEQGSIQVSYEGMYLELGGVVKLVDVQRRLIFDEELVEPDRMFASSRLEGVWWARSDESEMRFAISNVSGTEVTASISFSRGKHKPAFPRVLKLKPHETRIILDPKESLGSHEDGPFAGGVSIRHSGLPGDVIARGYIQEVSTGFSNVVEFYDPAMQKSSALDGVGLRIGHIAGQQLTPIAVARNVGTAVTMLTGRVTYTDDDGTVRKIDLPEMKLSPGETQPVDLSEAVAEHDPTRAASVGLEFQSAAGPGTFVMSALSVSKDGDQVFRVPLISAASLQSSTGNYPWSTDQNSSTFVYLKNVTDERETYTMYISYEGGEYTIGERSLDPRQTLAIDIRRLRDDKVRDIHGNTLPQTATHGQVHWSFRGLVDRGIIGRAEQVDLKDGISMTSSCGECCGDSPYRGWLTPDSIVTNVGASGIQSTAWEQDQSCYNSLYQPYSILPTDVSWDTEDHSVATVDSSGTETPAGAGSTYVHGVWAIYVPQYDPENQVCNNQDSSFTGLASLQVKGTPDHMTVTSDTHGNLNCANQSNPLFREVKYAIYDAVGNQITQTNFQYREVLSNLSTNSCGGGVSVNNNCSNLPVLNFVDNLSTGCFVGTPSTPCGWTASNQQWQWCKPDGSTESIGTPGALFVHNDFITVNGNSLSLVGVTPPK